MTVTRRRALALSAGATASALLGGCATPAAITALQADWPPGLPPRVMLDGVPFFPQDDLLCGPATLATVAQAAGRRVTPAELTPQVYLPGRQGSLQTEMLAAARRQGLVAYPIAPRLPVLLAELADGAPVLVLQNLALPIAPQWHYAVAVGFDRDRAELYLHSGTTPRLPTALRTFEFTWARAEHWAVRVTAPSRVPVTAEADGWARAVAALERSDVAAAEVAYRSGLARWPTHRFLLLGAGNTAHAQGRLTQAADAYERTVIQHPDFADAWHNLAQTRLDLRQRDAARRAAARAVALGGPRQADYRALLARAEAAR